MKSIVAVLSLILIAVLPHYSIAKSYMGCLFSNYSGAIAHIEYHYTGISDVNGLEVASTQQGSGFLITKDGFILTNAHVVTPDQSRVLTHELNVRLGFVSAAPIRAEIRGIDAENDLALLQIPRVGANDYPTVPLGISSPLGVGDTVIGIGFPSGSDLAMTNEATITSRNAIYSSELKSWWQTSLGLESGDSGGPVFGASGTVVGVAVAARADAQQLSYVIPIQYASTILNQVDVPLNQASQTCSNAALIWVEREETINIPEGQRNEIELPCPEGMTVAGGGYAIGSNVTFASESLPSPQRNSWIVRLQAPPLGEEHNLVTHVFASCVR